jgi:cysteinyl-tRNA synthetase
MNLARWCEFMRDMKEVNGLTNQYIAEKSGVSIKTIERIMALNADQDIMRETARRIEDAIIGSSNQSPCILAYEEAVPQNTKQLDEALKDREQALNEIKEYRAMLEGLFNSHNAEVQSIRDEAKQKIDFLLAEIEQLRKDNDNLWAENNRKSKVVDMFLEKQNVLLAMKDK